MPPPAIRLGPPCAAACAIRAPAKPCACGGLAPVPARPGSPAIPAGLRGCIFAIRCIFCCCCFCFCPRVPAVRPVSSPSVPLICCFVRSKACCSRCCAIVPGCCCIFICISRAAACFSDVSFCSANKSRSSLLAP